MLISENVDADILIYLLQLIFSSIKFYSSFVFEYGNV